MKNLINLLQNVDQLGFTTLYHVVRFDSKKQSFLDISSFIYSTYDEALAELETWNRFKPGTYFVRELNFLVKN